MVPMMGGYATLIHPNKPSISPTANTPKVVALSMFSFLKKIQKEQMKKKINTTKLERLTTRINNIKHSLSLLIGDIEFSSSKEFKKKRSLLLKPLKGDFLRKCSSLDIQTLIRESFEKELLDFTQNDNHYVLKRIFKPYYPTIPLEKIDYVPVVI